MAVAKRLSDGSANMDFGDDGTVVVPVDLIPDADAAYGMALQSDGSIVLAGLAQAGDTDRRTALVRLTRGGLLDPGFGMLGRRIYDFGLGEDGPLIPTGVAASHQRFIVGGVTQG